MNMPEGWPTDEMIFAAIEACDDMFQTDFIRAFKAALAAAPTPPAQDDEPYLWECEYENEVRYVKSRKYMEQYQALGWKITPLHTHTDTELRKAAEELLNHIRSHLVNHYIPTELQENLRAALNKGES